MIEVTGLSVTQIEVKIRNEYINQKIFRNPTVIVEITSYSPKYVYISGSVNKSGPFALPNEANAISITELINMSGGFNPIANKKKVSVTRTFRDRAQNVVETKVYVVDVEALSNGTTNIKGQKWWIYPGDQINVPERLFLIRIVDQQLTDELTSSKSSQKAKSFSDFFLIIRDRWLISLSIALPIALAFAYNELQVPGVL